MADEMLVIADDGSNDWMLRSTLAIHPILPMASTFNVPDFGWIRASGFCRKLFRKSTATNLRLRATPSLRWSCIC